MSETVISVANIDWVKYKAQVRLSELGLSTADLFTRGKTSSAKTDLAFRLHAYLRASEYVDLFDEHNVLPMLECMVGDETTSDIATFSPILATEPCIVFPGCAASDDNSQVITETFTGDGSTDTYNLLYTPAAMVAVSVGGLVYLPSIHYTYSASTLTFSTPPYSGAEILVIYLRGGVTVVSGGISDGDKGDIIVSSGGTVWTIDSDFAGSGLTIASGELDLGGALDQDTDITGGGLYDLSLGTSSSPLAKFTVEAINDIRLDTNGGGGIELDTGGGGRIDLHTNGGGRIDIDTAGGGRIDLATDGGGDINLLAGSSNVYLESDDGSNNAYVDVASTTIEVIATDSVGDSGYVQVTGDAVQISAVDASSGTARIDVKKEGDIEIVSGKIFIAEAATTSITGASETINFRTTGNNPVIDFAAHSGAVTIDFTNGANGQSGFIRLIKGANSVTPTFQYGGSAADFLTGDGDAFDPSALTDNQEQLMGYFISGGDMFITGLSPIYK